MSSTRENSMKWQDHQDNNHMSDEKMSFYVVADEYSRSHMRMPQVVGSYFRTNISDTIKLNAPNGCMYDIGVCREMDEIVLRSGWDVFATAHNLVQNDYLVFKFCGNSSFKVQIHSSHGGSRKITSFVNPHPEILEAIPPSANCDPHIPNGNEMPYGGHVHIPAEFDYFTSGGSCLTKAQNKKVLEIAHTIRSEIPLYVAVMNKSNVDLNGCSIRIPSILMKDVAKEVLEVTVKLEAPDAKVYSVSATKLGNDETVLQSGWDAFVVAHNVQERDLIIFRHKGNSRLEVFILGPSGYHKTSSWFGMRDVSNTKGMCDDSCFGMCDGLPPHKTVDVIDLSSSSDDESNVAAYSAKSARRQKLPLGNLAKTRAMVSTSCPSIKSVNETREDLQAAMDPRVDHSPFNSNNSEGLSQPPYMISKKLTCPRAQEMVLQKVQAIRSRFPIYVAVLTGISTGQKGYLIRYSRRYARRCLPSTTQGLTLELEGCQSKEWQTVLHVQGGHSKSSNDVIIYHGWSAFASDNRLRLGDICLFELVSIMTRLKMKVHIIRKSGGYYADM